MPLADTKVKQAKNLATRGVRMQWRPREMGVIGQLRQAPHALAEVDMLNRFLPAGATTMLVAMLVSGCASQVQIPAPSANLTLTGRLYRPDTSGRLPAVILLAPCGGVTQHMGEWASWLKGQGYIALIVDSFSPRGAQNACQGESPRVPEAARDAIDALIYLRSSPLVDGDRVAVMGWSHGGAAALQASSRHSGPSSVSGDRLAFRAAVAFYPNCPFLDVRTATPTLLLLAGRDDWTPPGQCVAIGELARQAGGPVSWELYPKALHAFDRPGPMTTYLGHTMAYDGKAADAAREAVRKFLDEQLQSMHP